MKKSMNRNCYWCGLFGEKCKALEEPVCKTRKCSFFETTADFLERQEQFRKKMMEKKLRLRKKWCDRT